jgi:hypothetical protein
MGTRSNFTVPGGATFDTSTLYIDDPNNRVGVVNTNPQHALDVAGVIRASSGVIGLTSTGIPAASLADGAFAVDTMNNTLYFRSGSTWRQAAPDFTQTFTVPGPLTVGTGKARFYFNQEVQIANVMASVDTAPTGASVIVDVNVNGTTIFTTQANRPTIAASQFTDLSSVPNITTVGATAYVTVDIDQVGSDLPGADLVVQIQYRQRILGSPP